MRHEQPVCAVLRSLPNGRVCSARPGVVIIIMLLALILLALMIFYVFNSGHHIERRVKTQNAADTAAIVGATVMARSFNTVAMNNFSITRMIGTINLLDSVPLAIEMAIGESGGGRLGDIEAVGLAVEDQLDRGVTNVWVRALLEDMVSPTGSSGFGDLWQDLNQLNDYFQANPDIVPNMTNYNPPSGDRGAIWEAMYGLDALSRLSLEWLPIVMQSSVVESGEVILGDNATVGQSLLVPILPNVPWERGSFNDFERPVRFGLLPGADERLWADSTSDGFGQIDHTVLRRGPFDAVFGWRWMNGHGGYSIAPHQNSSSVPGPSSPPISSGGGFDPGGYVSPVEPTWYRVYGVHRWMLRYTTPDGDNRHDYDDMVERLIDQMASIKLQYLFRDLETQMIHLPEWEIDYDSDNQRSNDSNEYSITGITEGTDLDENGEAIDVVSTGFVVAEMKSRIENDPGQPANQGVTWNYAQRTGYDLPFVYEAGGWHDPDTGPPYPIRDTDGNELTNEQLNWQKLDDWIWQAQFSYTVNQPDPDIGLTLPIVGTEPLPNGVEVPVYGEATVYWTVNFILVGIDIGPEVEVPNPYEGFDRNSEDAPAPYDLVHDDMDFDDDANTSPYLNVLGVARREARPLYWPGRFGRGLPHSDMVGIAEAHVFNNHSRDLWTQMWHAQLKPVENYEQWVEQLQQTQGDAGSVPNLSAEALPELADYLQSLEPVADVMLTH